VFLLHAGETIRISCPAYLSNGGAELYSHFGSKKIPANTPLTYDLEILECDENLADITEKGKKHNAEPMKVFTHNNSVF